MVAAKAALLATAIAGMSVAASSAVAGPLVLDGVFIKIGLNEQGTLGVGGRTSPGILYDGTGTGTFNPAYDYLTPGSPFEGFTITGNATTGFTVSNNNAYSPAFSGTLTSYNGIVYAGSTYDNRAVWTGTYGSAFSVTNDYFFNEGGQQLGIKTTITALSDLTNVAFSRQIDPDAVAAPGDSSATNNFRGASGVPASDLVYAEALSSKYVIGLYTNSAFTHNSAVTSWTRDTASYLSGTNIGNGDNVIGLGFSIGNLLAGQSASVDYSYIFGTNIAAAVGAGTAAPAPTPTEITTTATSAELIAGRVLPVLNGGVLHASSTGTISSDITLKPAGGTISTDGHALSVSSDIEGDGDLTKAGAGTLMLSGSNTYTGRTIITDGSLALAGNGSLASSSGVTANGTFDVAPHTGDVSIRSIDGTGSVALGSNGLVLTDAADRFDGTIAGSGGVNVAGGTQQLGGSNSYTGRTIIAEGATLGLAGSGSLANSSGVTANGTFDVAPHTGDVSIRTIDGTGSVALGNNGLVLTDAADRFDGTIAGSGGVTVAGGTQQLGGSNSYTGRTIIAEGATLGLAGSGSLANSSGVTANGTFDVAPHTGDVSIRTIDGTGSVALGSNGL
ncbi:beta strand repeat-containing protein, partial [Sphingomonas echinoides]|uniref:beta strand repeat-containing protein n=1 Tax=Sphingomonas echinoides TaxID=59803 RepID=UPI002413B818